MVGPPVLPGTVLSLPAGISAQIDLRKNGFETREITEATEIFSRRQRIPLPFLLCVLCDLCVNYSSSLPSHRLTVSYVSEDAFIGDTERCQAGGRLITSWSWKTVTELGSPPATTVQPEQSRGHFKPVYERGSRMNTSITMKDIAEVYVGIDVSKSHLDVGLYPGDGVRRFRNDGVGVGEMLD
mgnify:CR=1 FL=1